MVVMVLWRGGDVMAGAGTVCDVIQGATVKQQQKVNKVVPSHQRSMSDLSSGRTTTPPSNTPRRAFDTTAVVFPRASRNRTRGQYALLV